MKKRIKLSEKDLSELIQKKMNELYDDPMVKNKFENEINENLGKGVDAFIEGFQHIEKVINLLGGKDDKRATALYKILEDIYQPIETINDLYKEIDPNMGFKNLEEDSAIDTILDKISKNSIKSLSDREKEMLDMASKGKNIDDILKSRKGLEVIADKSYQMPFIYIHDKIEETEDNIKLYGKIKIFDFEFDGYIISTHYSELYDYEFVDEDGININDVVGKNKTDLNKFLWKVIDEIIYNNREN